MNSVLQSFAHLGLAAEKVGSTPILMCILNCVATLVGGFMITQKKLKELLHYNPETGVFTWTSDAYYTVAGKKAGWLSQGYIRISIGGKNYLAHRLAWLYVYGEFPKDCTDHINCIGRDNRICNLREATNQENQCNKPANKNNKSGYKGVCWNKTNNKFVAQIKINNKQVRIGQFDCPKEAHKAYCEAADELHKEFANHG